MLAGSGGLLDLFGVLRVRRRQDDSIDTGVGQDRSIIASKYELLCFGERNGFRGLSA